MRITQTQEWALAAILIVYIAFTPGFQVVRSFLSSSVGKAIGLAVIVYVWKYVSALLGLLLTVSFIRCAGMREGVNDTLATPAMFTCPEGTTKMSDKPGKCKKADGTEVDAIKVEATSAPPAPPAAPAAPATGGSSTPSTGASSVTLPQIPAAPAMEHFSPREEMVGSMGCSFSPV